MKLSDKPADATQRVLLFGPPKTGKTEMFGRLAEKYKLILFDLERGWSTLRKLPQPWQERIEIISLPDTRDFPIAIETMLKVIKGTEVHICEKHGKVACNLCRSDGSPSIRICLNELGVDTIVGVDSLTQLTNSAIANITKGKGDDYKPDWDDWGKLGKLMDTFLGYVQQAPYNIVCMTHETETEMEDGKNKLVPTAGTRNFSRNTAKYFDHVVYAEVKNKRHVFASSTTYAGNILTGSRTDIVLETLKEGELPSLLKIFNGEIGAPSIQQNSQGTSALAGLKKNLLIK